VTGEVESGQRVLESLVRRLPPLTVPGSHWRWQVGLGTGAQEKRILSKLPALLSDMEKVNRRSTHYRGDYRDPLVQRLRDLGVEFVYAWEPADAMHQGDVILSPGPTEAGNGAEKPPMPGSRSSWPHAGASTRW
jgi:hypothetical protein